MLFNCGKPIFQWNTGQKLGAAKIADGEPYAHFRANAKIFCEVSTAASLDIEVTDERAYYEKSSSTALTFTYSGTAWQTGSPAADVDLDEYGIEVTGAPASNDSFAVKLTDLVSVAIVDNEVDIPNRLLQFAGPFLVYGYVVGDDDALTLVQEQYNVIGRPCPTEYVYEQTEVMPYADWVKLKADMTALKEALTNISFAINSNGHLEVTI